MLWPAWAITSRTNNRRSPAALVCPDLSANHRLRLYYSLSSPLTQDGQHNRHDRSFSATAHVSSGQRIFATGIVPLASPVCGRIVSRKQSGFARQNEPSDFRRTRRSPFWRDDQDWPRSSASSSFSPELARDHHGDQFRSGCCRSPTKKQ